MTTAIDQKAYLQKYLKGPSGEKKKKKKHGKGKGFKIIDDDLDLSKLRSLEGDELDILIEGEDAPQIAGIIDERPEELRKLDEFQSSSKWRVINQDDGFNSKLTVEEFKRNKNEVEKENEITFGKMYSDSEDEKQNNVGPSGENTTTKKFNSKNKDKHQSDSDFSPPRKNTTYDSDKYPPRKNIKKDLQNKVPSNKSDSDVSPPRRKYSDSSKSQKKYDLGRTQPRKYTKESEQSHNVKQDSDSSPPRRERSNKSQNYESDPSPPRRKEMKPKERIRKPSRWGDFKEEENKWRQDQMRSESSTSNEKYIHKNFPEQSQSSYHKNTNRNKHYESDASPPRKSRRDSPKRSKNTDSDISPPRKRRLSPERRMSTYDKNSMSPRRNNQSRHPEQSRKRSVGNDHKRSKQTDSDLSPPRKENKTNHSRNNHSHKRNDSDSDLSPVRKNKLNNERRDHKRNNDDPPPANKRMERTLEGKKAGLQDAKQLKHENETFRRKEDEAFKNMTDEMSGRNAKAVSRKGKRETSEDKQKHKEKAERQKELDEKYKKWNKGLKQIESQQAAVEEFIHEASKPLARYKDDRDLESRLKDVERQGDPMLKYMKEKKREKGELGPEKPMYKGNFAPNRFNIRPGYRWDGVDRSNGYEKKFFEQQSKKKAQEEEVYKWSTEDL